MKKKFFLFMVILLCAFLVRFWGIWFDLPQVYTTEEYKVINYALKMGATKSLNPHFFNYPSLYLYFTLFISGCYFGIGKIFGIFSTTKDFAYSFIQNPTTIYIILRIISAVWSTAILVILYLIAKKIWSFNIGVFAMLMISFIPSIIESSHLVQPGLTSVFFVLCCFYFLIHFLQTAKVKYYFLSSAILGLAISTFYTAIPMVVIIPLIYWIYSKKLILDKHLLISILLVSLFFFLGTPYALFDFKTFLKDFIGHTTGAGKNILQSSLAVLYNLFFIGNRGHVTDPIGPPFIGLVSFLGMIQLIKEKKIEGLLILLSIILFSIPGVMYHSSGVGYIFPAIPFFLLCGAYFVSKFFESKSKTLTSILFFILLVPSILLCVRIDHSYSLKDTRTIAKYWIEGNIPSKSKILIDMYPHSPPLKETKEQLERLYHRAAELNHYKKEYLKLQLEVHPGKNYGYEIYRVYRLAELVSGTIELVKEAQKVQDLIDVSYGFDYLRKLKIKYIILNSWDRISALNSQDEGLKRFYEAVPKECRLLKEFKPEKKLDRGSEISIYQIKFQK